MMVAAVAIAVALSIGVKLWKRSDHLRSVGFLHSVEAARLERLLVEDAVDRPLAATILDMVRWHDEISEIYRRSARNPWIPLGTIPPAPRTLVLTPAVAAKYKRGRFPFPPPP